MHLPPLNKNYSELADYIETNVGQKGHDAPVIAEHGYNLPSVVGQDQRKWVTGK